jgi:hypothetical protein
VNETDNATSNMHRTDEPLLLKDAEYCFRFFSKTLGSHITVPLEVGSPCQKKALAGRKLRGLNPSREASVALTPLYYRFLPVQKE